MDGEVHDFLNLQGGTVGRLDLLADQCADERDVRRLRRTPGDQAEVVEFRDIPRDHCGLGDLRHGLLIGGGDGLHDVLRGVGSAVLEVVVQALLHDVLGGALVCRSATGDERCDEVLPCRRVGVDVGVEGGAREAGVSCVARGVEAFAGLGHVGREASPLDVGFGYGGGCSRGAEAAGDAEHHERRGFLRIGDVAGVQERGIDEILDGGQTLRALRGGGHDFIEKVKRAAADRLLHGLHGDRAHFQRHIRGIHLLRGCHRGTDDFVRVDRGVDDGLLDDVAGENITRGVFRGDELDGALHDVLRVFRIRLARGGSRCLQVERDAGGVG